MLPVAAKLKVELIGSVLFTDDTNIKTIYTDNTGVIDIPVKLIKETVYSVKLSVI
jgi:regulatory protein YycH of two-component signal transduction system YycFG